MGPRVYPQAPARAFVVGGWRGLGGDGMARGSGGFGKMVVGTMIGETRKTFPTMGRCDNDAQGVFPPLKVFGRGF